MPNSPDVPPNPIPETTTQAPSAAPEGPTQSLPPPVEPVPLAPAPTCPTRITPPPFAQAAPWRVGFTFLDDFQVEGVLGCGGMGEVYLVRQQSSGRPFAAKRARFLRGDSRRRFLAELQVWLDLPAHAHLAPCRFFRSVEDEVVIFSDHAAGGSLADWIVGGRLARLEDRLDVAIQVARGLHALHEHGLVHQDVKPANVLMSADGLAQVADFGLARARARARLADTDAGEAGHSVLVSGGAMTPAYCSPEQASGQPVSRKTDVWSWGVLVLETFVGRVPACEAGGPRAGAVLERYLAAEADNPPHERLPDGLAEVLRRAFQPKPPERWPDLEQAAEALVRLYRDCSGHAYPRTAATPAGAARTPMVPSWSEASLVGGWDPPRKWLSLALRRAGRDPTEAEEVLPPPGAGRKAQAVANLATYDEARQLLEAQAGQGDREALALLAGLLVQKARVHGSLGDWPGALDLYDRALALWRELIHAGRRELTPNLVCSLLYKSAALRGLGEHGPALALCDEVIALWQRLDNRRARRDLSGDLAAAQRGKGLSLRGLGQTRAACERFAEAVRLYEQLTEQGSDEPANELAGACLSQGSALSALGEHGRALECCERAIQLRKRLVQREQRPELAGDLAHAYLLKATVLRTQDDVAAALPLYELAVGLFERLVEQEGRDDLAHDLAKAYLARANADRALGKPRDAAGCCARAGAVWERLVHQEGRSELTPDLARAWQHRATALRSAGEAGEALTWSEQAVSLLDRLVRQEGRQDLANDLARAWVGQAGILRALRQPRRALALHEQAERLRRELLGQTGREDVEGDLARDRVGWLELLAEVGERESAKAELAEAVKRLEALARKTRRSDLRTALHRAWRLERELG
jgi:serine/threonine protein kinase/tetratricopeptide (TPR) repeat protein